MVPAVWHVTWDDRYPFIFVEVFRFALSNVNIYDVVRDFPLTIFDDLCYVDLAVPETDDSRTSSRYDTLQCE